MTEDQIMYIFYLIVFISLGIITLWHYKLLTLKNFKYFTFWGAAVFTWFWGVDQGGIDLLYFGGGNDSSFRFGIDEELLFILAYFSPYIALKIYERYKDE